MSASGEKAKARFNRHHIASDAPLNDYARAQAPFARIGQESVTLQITSVVRVSDVSFQVRWAENRFVNGTAAGPARGAAMASVVVQPSRNEDRLRRDPLGIVGCQLATGVPRSHA